MTNAQSVPELNVDEELAFIRKTIADSRRAFAEDGKPYIVWGILVALGMLLTYLSALTLTNLHTGIVWIALTLAGWGYIGYYVWKKKKRDRIHSFVDRIQGSIWGACGATLGMTIFLIMIDYAPTPAPAGDIGSLFILPRIHPFYICFFTAAILGIAYFLSGIANDLRWLRNIGFAWWAGAVLMFFWHSIHVLGFYALMIVLFQVVPGMVLNRRYRQEQVTASQEA